MKWEALEFTLTIVEPTMVSESKHQSFLVPARICGGAKVCVNLATAAFAPRGTVKVVIYLDCGAH